MKNRDALRQWLLGEQAMLWVVALNAVVIFLQESGVEWWPLTVVDSLCTVVFMVEMGVKLRVQGWRVYWRSGWNVLDGAVTLLAVPSLLVYVVPGLGVTKVLMVLRLLRLFKLFRLVRHFPNLKALWAGFMLALRQSAAFLLAYAVVLVVVAIINSAFFGSLAPQYFRTPLDGMYAMLQLFTVEGWYDIPNAICVGLKPVWVHVVRLYFCLLLIGGGIIGMSLINSIFVDAMVADNNDDVKQKLDDIETRIAEGQHRVEQQMEELAKQLKDKA
ncbi:MAG: ion transporter [Bacteroidales bacterium]|nr:ion transporter [Bacteroidales bacterium]